MPSAPKEKASKPSLKRPCGRSKGSKNHAKVAAPLSPRLALLQKSLAGLKTQMMTLATEHIVVDGKFGNAPSIGLVRETGLHIVSKLRQKEYPELLNIVLIRKTQLKTGKVAEVLLFSTDLSLTAAQIIDYYSLRFQIEFNFRDAKQYWGLEDFMNVSPQAVTNVVNVSQVLLKPYRQHEPPFSVLELKDQFRAHCYLSETIKLLPFSPEPHLIARIWQCLTRFGAIRNRPCHDFAA